MVKPLSPGRYKVQFTASDALRHKLERLRALMGAPAGDLAAVIEQAVSEKLERLEARRFSQTKARRRGPTETKPKRSPEFRARDTAPSPSSRPVHTATEQIRPPSSSRHIPAAVRRAVYERDGDGGQRKSGVGDAPSATGWNSTTGTRSASAVTPAWQTSA